MTSSNHISKLSTYTLYFQLILFTAYKKNLKRLKRPGAMSKGSYLKNDTKTRYKPKRNWHEIEKRIHVHAAFRHVQILEQN